MPKKKKGDAKDPHEGRPSNTITFGDFLLAKAKQQSPQQGDSGVNHDVPVSPALSCSKEETENKVVEEPPKSVYFVCRTKKGGVPVKVESRSSGKKVTVVEHVLGDGKKLLQELKTKFGTGGIFYDDNIELQGDCKTKVMKYFGDNKNLLKPYGSKLS